MDRRRFTVSIYLRYFCAPSLPLFHFDDQCPITKVRSPLYPLSFCQDRELLILKYSRGIKRYHTFLDLINLEAIPLLYDTDVLASYHCCGLSVLLLFSPHHLQPIQLLFANCVPSRARSRHSPLCILKEEANMPSKMFPSPLVCNKGG